MMEIAINKSDSATHDKAAGCTAIVRTTDTETWPELMGEFFTLLKGFGFVTDLSEDDIVRVIYEAIFEEMWDKEEKENSIDDTYSETD